MSICCLTIILVIIIVGILIVYVLRQLQTKISDTINKYTTTTPPTNETVHQDVRISPQQTTVTQVPSPPPPPPPLQFNTAIFSIHEKRPSIRLCSGNCDFIEFCNVQMCRHLVEQARIDNDKNTIQNVTYIHLTKCIIVFVTKNDNICKKEQEFITSEDDINYINSYVSKYIELAAYTIFFDRDQQKFIDFHGPPTDEYTLDINGDKQKERNTKQQPTAPPQLAASSTTSSSSQPQGQFFYIT